MKTKNTQKEIKDLRLLIKQRTITNREVIRELREINKRLENNKQKTSVMNRTTEAKQTI